MTIVAAPEALAGVRVSRSREAHRQSYFLMTPDNHFPGCLPHMRDIVVRRLVTPRVGTAKFGQYRLDLAPGGCTTQPLTPMFEHFLYVLDGALVATMDGESIELDAGGYLFAPDRHELSLAAHSIGETRALLFRRRYEPWDRVAAPATVTGHVNHIPPSPTSVAGVGRRELLPNDDPSYDFNISLISFEPGTCFSKVEVHDEEHGLYMTQGQGIYQLDGDMHEVCCDDFIYMAPYCPQYFYALGPGCSEYLLYKDMWRDGF